MKPGDQGQPGPSTKAAQPGSRVGCSWALVPRGVRANVTVHGLCLSVSGDVLFDGGVGAVAMFILRSEAAQQQAKRLARALRYGEIAAAVHVADKAIIPNVINAAPWL